MADGMPGELDSPQKDRTVNDAMYTDASLNSDESLQLIKHLKRIPVIIPATPISARELLRAANGSSLAEMVAFSKQRGQSECDPIYRANDSRRLKQSIFPIVDDVFKSQVLSGRVRHIEYTPSVPEPFYAPTGKEPRPKPLGDELGTVVFRYYPTSITNYVS